MAKARARHILVATEEVCQALKKSIAEDGADFADLAQKYSQCPSGQRGGDLGQFGPGQMVPEFDPVRFNGEAGVVPGPVKTQVGYHRVEVTERS